MNLGHLVVPPARVRDGADPGPLERAFAALRAQLGLRLDYPADALAEAARAARTVRLPARDETGVPFFTIDPPGSMDLDQAMFLERADDGYRIRYAIADVASYVAPGGALDTETRRRGQTMYLPDVHVPLHPAILSEDAASLLAGRVRSAFVWDIGLTATGEIRCSQVYRARVRSAARLDYVTVQRRIDDGSASDALRLLEEVGRLRMAREAERGGANLPMPEQEVDKAGDGTYHLTFRPQLPVEEWNAQISLLTGMAAAHLMLQAKIGILRTMPAPEQVSVDRFRRRAAALGVDWPAGRPYGEFIRGLDRSNPRHLALIHDATTLFRGAGYTAFDGAVPQERIQAAVAAPYAHVTAPLRRLVDRFGLVVCEAVSAGNRVPDWVRDALPTLPEIMRASDQTASQVDHACTDTVQAALLAHRVGETFAAHVVDTNGRSVTVQLADVAVMAKVPGLANEGDAVRVRLTAAEISTHAVTFELVRPG